MPIKGFIIFVALILGTVPGWAQILDDSTEVVYGPSTSKFIYESDLRQNKGTYQVIDTSLQNIHRFDPVNVLENKYQYLGVMGTAMAPIFYRVHDQVGVDHGFHSYDPYFKDNSKFKYYDTKSPFMDLSIFLGGNRRSLVKWDVSQNVKPNWNVGFDIYSLVADRQYGANASRGDRNATNLSYAGYTHYKTNDSTYQLMANFSRMQHQVWETGGIIAFDDGDQEEFYQELFDEDADVWLRDVQSRDLRQNMHIYHQVDLGSLLQVYHALDWNKQWNSFGTFEVQSNEIYWDDILFNTDSTVDRSSYREFTNYIGAKGDFRGFLYDFHYKRRNVRFVPRYLPVQGPIQENFVGGRLGYQLTPDIFIEAEAEFIVLVQNYRIKAKAKYKWVDLEVGRSQYKPSFIHQSYFSNHIEWRRFPISPIDDFLRLGGNLNYKAHHFRPYIHFTQVTNPIYYNFDKRPNQAAGAAQIASIGVISELRFLDVLHFDSEIKYTNVSGAAADVFRIPQIYLNGKFYFEDQVFLEKLWMQLGLDMHWKSTYMANSYDPVTQQFYLQNDYEVPSYLLVDLFFNFKVGHALLFVKMINLMEGILADGYLTTPFYRGTNRNFDLGLKWFFFD